VLLQCTTCRCLLHNDCVGGADPIKATVFCNQHCVPEFKWRKPEKPPVELKPPQSEISEEDPNVFTFQTSSSQESSEAEQSSLVLLRKRPAPSKLQEKEGRSITKRPRFSTETPTKAKKPHQQQDEDESTQSVFVDWPAYQQAYFANSIPKQSKQILKTLKHTKVLKDLAKITQSVSQPVSEPQ
jgi:hypothetical protein